MKRFNPELEDDLDTPEPLEPSEPQGPAAPRSQARRSVGCLIPAFLVAFMALAIVFMVVRTRSGSDMVSNALRKQTGVDLEIGEASLGLPFDLVLRGVKERAAQAYGGFRAREIRMGLRWEGTLDVQVTGAELELVKTADGWLPRSFERIAVLGDVRDTVALFADMPDNVTLDLRESSIVWKGPDSDVTASVQGLTFWSAPVTLPGRRMRFYELSAREVRRVGGAGGRAVRRFWLSAPEARYVEIAYHAIWESGTPGARDWWSVPSEGGTTGVTGNEK